MTSAILRMVTRHHLRSCGLPAESDTYHLGVLRPVILINVKGLSLYNNKTFLIIYITQH